ncbi:MAG: hypothetical protein HIU83_16185 [Proteobacteria bacterium]|nr:hypothetical protein [Pseudomonadota bacterium]
MRKSVLLYVIATSLLLPSGFVFAADQQRDQDRTKDKIQDQKQDKSQVQIYGSQLMTQQERAEYSARMRAAKTVKEREQIRTQHHELMKARAKAKGITLPDVPPARGMGMGPGGGMGPGNGMGPGGGMGTGGGRKY